MRYPSVMVEKITALGSLFGKVIYIHISKHENYLKVIFVYKNQGYENLYETYRRRELAWRTPSYRSPMKI